MAGTKTPTAPERKAPPALGVWATVKLALTGKELDFTTGPIGRAIVLVSDRVAEDPRQP